MLNKNVQKALQEFKSRVIQQARSRLTKGNKNASKELYDSLSGNVTVSPNSFGLEFYMNPYGVFQDRGVKGTKSGSSLDNFSYKESSNLVGVEYHTGALSKWAKIRGIQPRGKSGRFGSYRTMGFILANTIKQRGIKPSLFFTKPFEEAFNDLPEDLIEAYGLDVEEFLQQSLTSNLN